MDDRGAVGSPFSVRFDVPAGEARRFSCKEAFDVAGHPADAGHPAYGAARAPGHTSRAVVAFVDAGYVFVGKTLASELLMSGLGANSRVALPANALDPGRVTGGSSVGCAVAVARGEVEVSIATDTAGSARIPAACHGLVGLSLAGSRPWLRDAVSFAPSLDQLGLIGPRWSEVERAARVLGVEGEEGTDGPLLVPWDVLEARCEIAHLDRFSRWVASLPAGSVRAVAARGAFDATDARDAALGGLALREIAASLAGFLSIHAADVDPGIRARLEPRIGPGRPKASERRRVWGALRSWRRGEGLGTLLMPTLPCAVPRVGEAPPREVGALTHYTNLMSEHALSLPVDGCDLSVQVVAGRYADVVAAARRIVGRA